MREFDLNIEKVLEHWTAVHAIREIIANALDERRITCTRNIDIYDDEQGNWHIRDYGRGIQYQHLTQKENYEKLDYPHLIGKFGVGLKDALAVFYRHKINVIIDSKFGRITIGKSKKHGFEDITTLHAYIDEPVDRNFVGTDFCIMGCTQKEIDTAKNMFLQFAQIEQLETTKYGEVFRKRGGISEIFINGVRVAEEENFMFSYNITSPTQVLRKSLNRDRKDVGRKAYSDRVRSILLSAKSDAILSELALNLTLISKGLQADEMKWIDIQTRAIQHLNTRKNTVFVTPDELRYSSSAVLEVMRNSGRTPVFVSEVIKDRLEDTTDAYGNEIATLQYVVTEYNNSFRYDFVDYEALTSWEKYVFDLHKKVLLVTQSSIKAEQIRITRFLQPDFPAESFAGIWDAENELIIIRRDMLHDPMTFCGVLIHELTHADTGHPDINRDFETALSKWIGFFAWKTISADNVD